MKKHWMKPGFELIFALSLIAAICLPPLVFAQGTRNVEINITNGDTIINGKNIKDLSPADRQLALKDIDNLGHISGPEGKKRPHLFLKRRLTDTGNENIVIEKRRMWNGDDGNAMGREFGMGKDSAGHTFKLRMKGFGDKDSVFTFNYRMKGDPDDHMEDHERNFNFRMRNPRMEFFRHRNLQSFDYSNTGTDGINTHVSFRVTDPSLEKLKTITGSEKAELEIKDLNLVPEFSSGKTMLMFNLPLKSVADVKLMDNEGKLIWNDKAMNGRFNKSFALGLNGVYYLQVKQAGKIVLKRIVKED